jgi:hypothetical protein
VEARGERSTPEVIAKVAAFGLPGQMTPILEEPLGEDAWGRLVRGVEHQRLAGFLRAAIDGGALPVTDQQRDHAAGLHLQACSTALLLERWLLAAADILEGAGIEVIVLKGTAVAHLAYADPALRSFGDNDLLFRSERFDDAVEVLTRHGYRRQTAQARPGFERRFAKGTTLSGAAGDELDLHRNLVFGTFGFRIGLDELFASAEPFSLGGQQLLGLDAETRLLHACYHAGLGDPVPRYGSVRDIAQMLSTGAHDPVRLLDLARRWQAEAVVARGVMLCEQLLGFRSTDPVARAVVGYVPTRRERRAIDSYVGSNRAFATKAVASLPYIDGVGAKVAFLRAVLAPEEGFAESFGGRSGFAWIRRGVRSLLGGHRQ